MLLRRLLRSDAADGGRPVGVRLGNGFPCRGVTFWPLLGGEGPWPAFRRPGPPCIPLLTRRPSVRPHGGHRRRCRTAADTPPPRPPCILSGRPRGPPVAARPGVGAAVCETAVGHVSRLGRLQDEATRTERNKNWSIRTPELTHLFKFVWFRRRFVSLIGGHLFRSSPVSRLFPLPPPAQSIFFPLPPSVLATLLPFTLPPQSSV